MASGDSAAEQVAAAQARATKYRLRAERADRVAGEWERGRQGEAALAEVMAPLASDGYYHLGDRRLPGSDGNIDHVLVGPAGVFVIDAKSWTGELRVLGGTLRQNGHRRDQHIERLRAQALGVVTVLEAAMGERRPLVRPVICFIEGAEIAARVVIDRVHLLNAGDLVAFARSIPRALDQPGIDEVMRSLLERLPARTAPTAAAAPVAAASTTTAPPPDEMVVFLQPWAKYGKRRLYVKASDGSEIGHLDLASGEVHTPRESWQPTLARLLPHYVADKAGGQAEKLSAEARSAFRRFLDRVLGRHPQPVPPLMAAYRWRNYGKERLYLHRIEAGGVKREVGWVDMMDGSVRASDPSAKPILTFCRDRFRSVTN